MIPPPLIPESLASALSVVLTKPSVRLRREAWNVLALLEQRLGSVTGTFHEFRRPHTSFSLVFTACSSFSFYGRCGISFSLIPSGPLPGQNYRKAGCLRGIPLTLERPEGRSCGYRGGR